MMKTTLRFFWAGRQGEGGPVAAVAVDSSDQLRSMAACEKQRGGDRTGVSRLCSGTGVATS